MTTAYLYLKGQRQGTIKGDSRQEQHESWIDVLASDHEISMPRDPATGLAAGRRSHKPLTLVLALDRSLPGLLNAFIHNENLVEATIAFWSIVKDVEAAQYTVKLTNAAIAGVRFMQATDGAVKPAPSQQLEIVLTYQKIEWTWNETGVAAVDEWDPSGM